MSEAKTLVTLMLGGVFNGTSGPELGDIDYQVNFEEAIALQQELVTNDDVYVDLVARSDFDAQRLRADTAEAERDTLRYKAELYDEVWADATGRGYANVTMALCALATAEQRNAQLASLLSHAKLAVDDVAENCESQEDWQTANSMHSLSLKIDAALNPKPEAGSHVDCGSCRNITDGCKDKCQRSEEWSKP